MSNKIEFAILDSPVGPLVIAEKASGVFMIRFDSESFTPPSDWIRAEDLPSGAMKQLDEYFRGERFDFDLPLSPEGTSFQIQVWNALPKIPYGKTVSYLDVAKQVGNPAAVRAVGAANGANPLPIVLPCHRVIGKNGKLTGYGGGLEKKQYLLSMESLYLGLPKVTQPLRPQDTKI